MSQRHVNFTRTFSAAHRIPLDPGKCSNIHGHNYVAQIEIEVPELDSCGFTVPFENVKAVVDRFDHKLILWDQDEFFQEFGPGGWAGHHGNIPAIIETYGIINVPFSPSTENLAQYLAECLAVGLSPTSEVWVRLRETDSIEAVGNVYVNG